TRGARTARCTPASRRPPCATSRRARGTCCTWRRGTSLASGAPMSQPTVFGGPIALTAIVAALDEELAPLRALLSVRTTGYLPGLRLTVGRRGGAPVALAVTGDGASNAREGFAKLVAHLPVSRIIVSGVSGALTSGVGVASLVLGERVVDAHDGSVRLADE